MSHAARCNWVRVSRRHPCAICGRPDWCLLATDQSAAICARERSDRPAGRGGWLHRLRDRAPWVQTRPFRTLSLDERPGIDFMALAARCTDALTPAGLNALAVALHVHPDALCRLGVGWSAEHRAYTFPMQDGAGNIVGIRLRLPNGRKLAVRGSREGLFVASWPETTGLDDIPAYIFSFIVEGPTDLAALLTLGLHGVGRPSCRGGTEQLLQMVRAGRMQHTVIVADADRPGREGARELARVLVPYVRELRIMEPPEGHKDVRAWVAAGATMQRVVDLAGLAPEVKITYRTEVKRRGH